MPTKILHYRERLERCPNCKWNYPDWYLTPMFTNLGATPPICGPCALEVGNTLMGINRTEFSGEQAEFNRLTHLEWREKHPECAPKKN